MGTTRMIPFTIEAAVEGQHWTPIEWHVRKPAWMRGRGRADGKPTRENIARWVEAHEASTRPGGANEHLGPARILAARIKDQRSGQYVAQWSRAGDLFANRAEPDPRVYLSFNTMQVGLRYRVIDQGMPISNDKETAEEALEAARQFKLKVSDRMWDGDRGEWTARLGRAGSNRAKTLDLVSTRPADLGKDDAGNRYQVVYVGTPRPMANKWDPIWYTTRNGDAIRGPVDRPSAINLAVMNTGETDPMSRAASDYGLAKSASNRAGGSKRSSSLSAPKRVATLAQLGHAYDSSLFYSVKAGKIYARERTGGGGYGRGRLGKAMLLGTIPGFKRGTFYSVKGGVISARRRK